MNILIDADGCPVVDLTLQIAKQFSVPVIILCDASHQIEREGAQTLVFDKGADSVDFALVNRVKPGDVVVTQDYGLASMCLAKCARVLNQNGLEYTADNIDALMLRRYENKKLLRAGKHPKGSPKRTKEQDARFADTLEKVVWYRECGVGVEVWGDPGLCFCEDGRFADSLEKIMNYKH